MAQLSLKSINKIYDKRNHVVKDVNLEIEDKEFVVLVGPSGCGKSTTLRMIAGLEEISGGELFIDGKRVDNVEAKDRDIAMVFQNYALYPHMTVFENMAFGLKIRKMPKNEINERVNNAAKILDLEKYLQRKPKELSGGQRQRVAVGRAIVRKPKVFLFDEPLSNLDAKLRVQMRAEISKLHKSLDSTMVYVTHDQTEAMTMGDRIVVMNEGIIQQADTPKEIYENPTNIFVAGFIGSPAMNFLEGELIKGTNISFKPDGSEIIIPINDNYKNLSGKTGKKIILGVRPETLSVEKSFGADDCSFTAPIDLFEPMGNEIFFHFKIGDKQLIGRTNNTDISLKLERKEIFLNLRKLYFFDTASGKRI